TITVTTINDFSAEDSERFTVTLSSPSPMGTQLGSPSVATVTITDTDAPGTLQFSSATYSVNEGAAALLTVTRTGGSSGTVTVGYGTANGGTGAPATGGNIDYTTSSGTLTFANGVTSRTISVPTMIDTAVEGPETFTVTLLNPTGGATIGATGAAIVTI